MRIIYTALKHISGLALIFFIVSFILTITDLENIGSVAIDIWLIKILLIAASFIINKWCDKRILELEGSPQE